MASYLKLLQFEMVCHMVIRKHAEGKTPPKFLLHATKSKSKIQIKFLQRLCGPDLYKTVKYTFH